jgi:type II restriction/modification system DNA methylase subunit YeeA
MDDLRTPHDLEGPLVEGYGEDALVDNWIDEVLEVLGFGTQEEVTLPDPDDVADDLERYLEAVERAAELDEKIRRTDDLIDEIVYDLYGQTDEEIGTAEGAVNGD